MSPTREAGQAGRPRLSSSPGLSASPPLVSVIMTTANSLAYLHTAVDSILSQTHTNLELIIVDDSSTDGTFEEALALAASDPRVQPIHSLQAAGTYVAKNLGLTLARGEYVAFQDSDDWRRPTAWPSKLLCWRPTRAWWPAYATTSAAIKMGASS